MIASFSPSAASGRQSRRQIQARLAESIGHVLEQCRGKVTFDEDAGGALLDILRSGRTVHPVVFGRYFLAVRAIMQSAERPEDEQVATIGLALKHLLDGPFEAEPGIVVRPLSRIGFGEQEERELREAFVSESLSDAQIVTVDGSTAERLRGDVDRALGLVRDHAPECYAEIEQCVCEIVPAAGRDSEDGLGFGGCSSLERWGSILINTNAMPTDIVLCEALIHEAAHNYLFGTSPVEFHLRNAPDERYRSPLRVDPRPLDGIYHATFVLARMCYGMREFVASPGLDADLRAEAQERLNEARRLFWDGYAVLGEHADYTDQGKAIMTAARDFMAGLEAPATA